ncbi:DNA replication and repair protein RecF [Gammaproteobacteria bacterium]|nr:DNA replication and repair protein RecF [Gammaproteobacteria bacterium]
MAFSNIELRNFRCFEKLSLDLSPKSTLLYGKNGCGKTSILESIFVASSGRSFRTSNLESLIKEGAEAFTIKAYDDLHGSILEIKKQRKHSISIKINDSRVTASELVRAFPSFSIDSKTFFYNDNAPEYRRKHIDRGLFVASPEYAKNWFGYFRALKQRNSALKQGSLSQARAYDHQLVVHGEKLNTLRSSLIHNTESVFSELTKRLLIESPRAKIFSDVSVKLFPGFDDQEGLQSELSQSTENDLRRRSTTKGPHKADVLFDSKGSLIKDIFSRGEQKLLSILWSISQNIMLGRVYNLQPILLLDDLSSELDSEMLECFLPVLQYIENRFIFSNIVDLFGSKIDKTNNQLKKFHVEQRPH